VSSMANPRIKSAPTPLRAWSGDEFLSRHFCRKEPLIDGLLYKRDLVSVIARRRHGKTSLTSNVCMAGALSYPDVLGYRMPASFRSLMLVLEDDPAEFQEKLRRMQGAGNIGDRLTVITREDFLDARKSYDIGSDALLNEVPRLAKTVEPDVIVIDNLAQVLNADYSDATKVHQLMVFAYGLARDCNAAVIIPAHPRKTDNKNPVSLVASPEMFAEEVMGSSHFVNSTGSIWALERDERSGKTVFLGGRQRGSGYSSTSSIYLDDCGWFRLCPEKADQMAQTINTEVRFKAWGLLPDPPAVFSYREGERTVKQVMRSSSSYSEWMKDLRRHGLVVDCGGSLCKASGLPSMIGAGLVDPRSSGGEPK
jgi:AAA domain